ncbi:sigma factor-like helix-turn-helix DNA-binding protein [Thioalkalivibrio sp. HK1]|uniref:sigma factor-like helix-turn-helix DNA-binding protein n=1 Tax=Thioalkalivibrio sp. HK1 TaxID=1469245 RepID=UPI000470E0EE|nr:sigma factor-like helix-turn-helix DNA-binding protein [Thioalkalivibrio sp. HK1]
MLNSNAPPSANDFTSDSENDKPSGLGDGSVTKKSNRKKAHDNAFAGDEKSPADFAHHSSSAAPDGRRDDSKRDGALANSQPSADAQSGSEAADFTFDRSINTNETKIDRKGARSKAHSRFQTEWVAAMARLGDRDRAILQRRIGLRTGAIDTLASIGEDLNVTRERVRQLEKIAHRRIFEEYDRGGRRLGAELVFQIEQSVADNNGQPLSLRQIGRINPWFAGTDRRILNHALDLMHPQRWHLVDVDNEAYLCDIPSHQWTTCLARGRDLLRLGSFNRTKDSGLRVIDPAKGLRRSVLRKKLNALLPSGTECAWVDLVLQSIARKAVFAEDGSGDPLLISAWRSGEAHIMRLLVESDHPIHHQEAKEILYRRYRVDIDHRRAHNALSGCGLLFGRGTYGLKKHLKLSNSRALSLVGEVERLAHRKPFTGRQWHCSEMLQCLGDRGYNLSGVDEYILHVALQIHNRKLDSLGRLMWIVGSGKLIRDTARRVPILSTVESILEEHGEPMGNTRLRKAVRERRGLGRNFALHPRGRLVRTERGRWGLADRDVPLDAVQLKHFVDAVMTLLEDDSERLEDRDLPMIAFEVTGVKDLDQVMLTSLLQRTGKVSFNRRGLVRRIDERDA